MQHILIVDDDADFRLSLAEILQEGGFRTSEADSGEACLKQVAAEQFDLILLDLVMPGIDGVDALRELKKIAGLTPVIMITGFATVENAVAAMKKGANDYIAKPFRTPELLATIRRVQEERRFVASVNLEGLGQALGALSNPIRRRIVELLDSGRIQRMTDLAQQLGIRDHTKVLFHLRSLKDSGVLLQGEDRAYFLSASGRELLSCMKNLKKKIVASS